MIRTHRSHPILASLVLALAACQPQSPAADTHTAGNAEIPAVPAVTPPAAVETTLAQSGVQPMDDALDSKALAGVFVGRAETLQLEADGGFTLTGSQSGHAGVDDVLRGTWSIEADGQRIRLDPDSKREPDRLFTLDGPDRLAPAAAAGQPDAAGAELQRRR